MAAALALLAEQYAPGRAGSASARARRWLHVRHRPGPRRPRGACSAAPAPSTLTPAQAETLAIVAYLQPISRPEITRIRGVSADSAAATLLERGLIEEAGRSQFGAVLYRTGTSFLKLFGLRSLDELPDVAQWDPTPEEQAELRERLLRAGEARAGGGPSGRGVAPRSPECARQPRVARPRADRRPHRCRGPRVRRTVASTPRSSSAARKAAIDSRLEPW